MEVRETLGGRYKLLGRLGSGGMAVVWRARDEVLGRRVAVKVLAARFAGDPQSRARIRDEARAAAALSHPNIAQVYDFGEASAGESGTPLPYVVMELINGPTLQQKVSAGPLPPRKVFRICGEVAAALAAAHADGLVHRDIKMANIMVTPMGAKVVDFGIAAAVGLEPEEMLVGTPAYLAPERLSGAAVEPASDVYALGVLLYRLLAHESPWSVESTTQMLQAHVYVDPAPLPDLPGVPAAVADLITRCLRKDPADRPTASEVSVTLADAAEAAAISHSVRAPDRDPGADGPSPAPERRTGTEPPAGQRHPDAGPADRRRSDAGPADQRRPDAGPAGHQRSDAGPADQRRPDADPAGHQRPDADPAGRRRPDADPAGRRRSDAGPAGGSGRGGDWDQRRPASGYVAEQRGADGGTDARVGAGAIPAGAVHGEPTPAGGGHAPAAFRRSDRAGARTSGGRAAAAPQSDNRAGATPPGGGRTGASSTAAGGHTGASSTAAGGHTGASSTAAGGRRGGSARVAFGYADGAAATRVEVLGSPGRETAVEGGRRPVQLERKKLLAGAAAVAVIVGGLAAWGLTGGGEGERRPEAAVAPTSPAPAASRGFGAPPMRADRGGQAPGVTESPAPGMTVSSGVLPSVAAPLLPVVPPRSAAPTVSDSAEAPPSASAAPPEGKKITSPGGTVHAVCEQGKARLTIWEAAPGFVAKDVEAGPAFTARIVFVTSDTEMQAGKPAKKYRITVTCVAGEPTPVMLPL
ncbi:serine/threonine-protein kinase [Paractinoplanes deccanensis]|uniref:serine/threonine-protein kinase n=2 Tax=Paractinoplanes deccanensis TaxID=113561 RepID=UPI001EF3C9C9|nr:serine/threonine-protein kinase [Actinoplanes deccanensis]